MSAELDAALADHRVLTHDEARTIAYAVLILERHAKGIREHVAHPDAGQAADMIERVAGEAAKLLDVALITGMVAPAGYTRGNQN